MKRTSVSELPIGSTPVIPSVSTPLWDSKQGKWYMSLTFGSGENPIPQDKTIVQFVALMGQEQKHSTEFEPGKYGTSRSNTFYPTALPGATVWIELYILP